MIPKVVLIIQKYSSLPGATKAEQPELCAFHSSRPPETSVGFTRGSTAGTAGTTRGCFEKKAGPAVESTRGCLSPRVESPGLSQSPGLSPRGWMSSRGLVCDSDKVHELFGIKGDQN